MINTIFNEALIEKYDKAGPRYTSYPTAVQFTETFTETDYRDEAQHANEDKRPLSLYFHIPFCDTICFYCGCNKIVTKNRKHSQPYLDRVFLEIERQGQIFNQKAPVKQLHWGGGTPTFLSKEEIFALMEKTRQHFQLLPDDQGEYSIEVDPRECNAAMTRYLREIGFNRLSMGVQDFDERVQKAVNRIQPKEITLETLNTAKDVGFNSISIDLIYGLPFQTLESFAATIESIIELSPDRLSVFNYAHMPHLFKTQRQMNADDMPTPEVKLHILKLIIERLTTAGYIYIGMDHFAKPTDPLAIAQKNGNLYRNFQGYSTHSDCDLIGLGISSISQIGRIYAQNTKEMADYQTMIDAGNLATKRGVKLTEDDLIRRHVITNIMCNLKLDLNEVSQTFKMDAREYFKADLPQLEAMQEDGLILIRDDCYYVQEPGRLLIRNIGMVFDAYLKNNDTRFSRVI